MLFLFPSLFFFFFAHLPLLWAAQEYTTTCVTGPDKRSSFRGANSSNYFSHLGILSVLAVIFYLTFNTKKKKLHGLSPRAKYTD
jgi:hypothetical protein